MDREAARGIETEPAQERNEMARFVRHIEELGPDVNEIARRMNVYKETARYWYKKKILSKGYSIQGSAAHLRLGLRRLIIIARVDPAYRKYVQELFVDMDGLWYAVGFSRTMPDDRVVIHASVPDDQMSAFTSFMNELKTKVGFFTELEFLPTDWIHRVPMQAEYHDFDRGEWEFDWSATASTGRSTAAPKEQARAQFDGDDLLIIRELQVNAARPLSKIAESLNMPYKKTLRHYRHIIDRGLISGFRLAWTRTRYINDERKLTTRKHSYMFCFIIIRKVKESELSKLVSEVERIPFLWAVCGGQHFLAEFFFPLDVVNVALKHLRRVVAGYGGRVSFFVADWDDTLSFSIPVEMYDRELKSWVFNRERTLTEFESNLDALVEKAKTPNTEFVLPSQKVHDSKKKRTEQSPK